MAYKYNHTWFSLAWCDMALTEADSDKAYASATDAIQNRIKARVGPKCCVVFSAYKFDADKVPIDNLDDAPISGRVLIKANRDRTRGGHLSGDYESPIMESPTWLDLCVIANDQITATRDRNRRYLEHVEVVEKTSEIQIAAFRLGA
jgi:hypothetical protein